LPKIRFSHEIDHIVKPYAVAIVARSAALNKKNAISEMIYHFLTPRRRQRSRKVY